MELQSRFEDCVLRWHLRVEAVVHTRSSLIAFGQCDQQPIVLKVTKRSGEEWFSGQVLNAFGGQSVVRALDKTDGAVLLERLVPGKSLAEMNMHDEEATAIIADVVRRMSPTSPPIGTLTIEAWGKSFEQYRAAPNAGMPIPLVEQAHRTYTTLCASQSSVRLLHGDLHHHNVILDSRRGWVAIDPKGVVGELAYEAGAALRNPCEQPALFSTPETIQRRVNCFARVLKLDSGRILAWAFAQAVLAAIWEWEDDGVLTAGLGWIALARSIQSMADFQRGQG
jgi:streptomycin 6-kinase